MADKNFLSSIVFEVNRRSEDKIHILNPNAISFEQTDLDEAEAMSIDRD